MNINIQHLTSMPQATTTTTSKEWKDFLLNHDRFIFVNGYLREIKARNLGCGVVELFTKEFQ